LDLQIIVPLSKPVYFFGRFSAVDTMRIRVSLQPLLLDVIDLCGKGMAI
jgi:hypothetical protein